MNRATISLDSSRMTTYAVHSFTGKPKGDEVVVDPHKVSRDHEDLARMLGVDHDGFSNGGNFLFRIAEMKHMVPVELGQELYDRVYGKDAVVDEAGFRAKVKEGLENMFRRDSDRIFRRIVMKKLQETTTPLELPDRFLKRWIQETSKNP
jgi:trigger factor